MKHFKNLKRHSAGFSFMEVMVALLMMGMLLTAIMTLQNNSFRSVITFSERLIHFFSLKNKFIEASFDRAQQKESSQAQEDKTTYSLTPLDEKSSLFTFKNMYKQKAQISWKEGNVALKEDLIGFLYKAPEKKEEKK